MPTNEKRILIVDDDDAIRTLLFTVLRRRGFAVDCARNGLEALARLQRCLYSVMLLDLMMPLKSGWDVMNELKTMPAEVRPIVIVLTAGRDPVLDPSIVALLIRKPFEVDLIVETVTACTNTLPARPQLPCCPPAGSTNTSPGEGS